MAWLSILKSKVLWFGLVAVVVVGVIGYQHGEITKLKSTNNLLTKNNATLTAQVGTVTAINNNFVQELHNNTEAIAGHMKQVYAMNDEIKASNAQIVANILNTKAPQTCDESMAYLIKVAPTLLGAQ
jgi:seryl-tRNA synthetase